MSTLKSSDDHLTLNADGSSKNILFQADGVQKASISSAGLLTSTTIDATVLTGNLPAISGASLTSLPSQTDQNFTNADHTKLDAIEARADANLANTAITTADTSWTGSQRATLVVDNDGSFDLNAGQNFKCTPAGGLTLTFTNFANGQSGYIILVNSGGHAIARHGDSIADANFVSTVSAAGTYIISYISDGTDAFLTNSAIMA